MNEFNHNTNVIRSEFIGQSGQIESDFTSQSKSKFKSSFGNEVRDKILEYQLHHEVGASLAIEKTPIGVKLYLKSQDGTILSWEEITVEDTSIVLTDVQLYSEDKLMRFELSNHSHIDCDLSEIFDNIAQNASDIQSLDNLIHIVRNEKQDKITSTNKLDVDLVDGVSTVGKTNDYNDLDNKLVQGSGIKIKTGNVVEADIHTINGKDIRGPGNIVAIEQESVIDIQTPSGDSIMNNRVGVLPGFGISYGDTTPDTSYVQTWICSDEEDAQNNSGDPVSISLAMMPGQRRNMNGYGVLTLENTDEEESN